MSTYEDKILEAFDEMFENPTSGSSESLPYQMICFDEKERWYFDPVKRHMVKICNNTEVVQISIPDKNNKVLVKGPGCFLYVPFEEIEDIGFN